MRGSPDEHEVRLHSSLGYVTPLDKLAGRDAEIFTSRDSKLEAARAKRLGAKSRAAEQAIDASPVFVPVLMRELGNSPRGVSEGGA